MEALQRIHNRGSISTGAYEIGNSCKFESDNDEWLSKTGTAGNRRTWTYSTWIKRTQTGDDCVIFSARNAGSNSGYFGMEFRAGDTFHLETYYTTLRYTDRVFRDTSAWYHIVVVCDSTQSTASNRLKLYVNGVEETSFSNGNNNMDQNFEFAINNNIEHRVGNSYYSGRRFNGYIAETHLVDGTSLLPTAFGEFAEDSGIWRPKEYTGNYGNNGFYLDFADANSLGNDANGGTDFTKTNIAASDQALDTPTNNFCTLALRVRAGSSSEDAPIREGGTYMPIDGTNQFLNYFGTIGVTKGKWYWEVYIPSRSASYGLLDYIGLHSMQVIPVGAGAVGGTSQCNYVLHYGDYNATVNGTNSGQNNAAGLPSYGTNGAGKVFGVAFDATNGKITYYESGNRIGNLNIDIFDLHDDMADGIFVHPFIQVYDNNMYINFGGVSSWASPSDYDKTDANEYGSFAHTPPTGYYALCTKNLAEFG